jgi:hypothetical protein
VAARRPLPRWSKPVTEALRSGSAESLRAALLRCLASEALPSDDRDVFIGLAPYHDCATRLGVDPAALFEEVAAAGPRELRDVVVSFGRRTDIRPAEWGFAVAETDEGPCYQPRSGF